MAVSVTFLYLGTRTNGETLWSPYQKLNIEPLTIDGEQVGYELRTNSSWYQKIINLSPEFVAQHPRLFNVIPAELNGFNLAYRFAPHPKSVLILGSGMGSDVAAALRAGAPHVTAVEIDPTIIKLGRELHPEHSYQSPRVTIVNDDARSFIQNTNQRFDVIVFSLLDSHTTSSHFTNIRIDNYVYTREAIEAGKRLLTPDGVYVLRFAVLRPWIAGRLHDLMTEVFRQEPLHVRADIGIYSSGGNFFVAGSKERIDAALVDPGFRDYVSKHASLDIEHVEVTTDDWPYFYQRDRGLPTSVVTISILLLLVCFFAARRVGLHLRAIKWEFFFLGAAFLLLEAQIISRMALLFGTTWIVNSIVISVLLLLIVAANGVAAALPRIPVNGAYAGIVVTIAICYVLPLHAIFFRSFALRATVATLLLCSPVFFAGIVFIKRFAASGFEAGAIGANLLGALAGGIIESLSLWLGLRALLLIAALLYAAAGLSLFQIGWLAAIYPAVWSAGQLLTGVISDRTGRKWLIASGMWVQAAGIVTVAISKFFWGFVSGAVLLGVGTAMVYPTLLAAIADHAHPLWRASSLGVYRFWRDLGYAIGALLSGLIADALSVGAAIHVVAAITLASGVASFAIMHDVRR